MMPEKFNSQKVKKIEYFPQFFIECRQTWLSDTHYNAILHTVKIFNIPSLIKDLEIKMLVDYGPKISENSKSENPTYVSFGHFF